MNYLNRPNNFNEIILDETTRKFVLNMIDDNNLHNTIFFYIHQEQEN